MKTTELKSQSNPYLGHLLQVDLSEVHEEPQGGCVPAAEHRLFKGGSEELVGVFAEVVAPKGDQRLAQQPPYQLQ